MHTEKKKKSPLNTEPAPTNTVPVHPQEQTPHEPVVAIVAPHEHKPEEKATEPPKHPEQRHGETRKHHHAPKQEKKPKKPNVPHVQEHGREHLSSAHEVSHDTKASHAPLKKRRRWNPLWLGFAAPFAAVWGALLLKAKVIQGFWKGTAPVQPSLDKLFGAKKSGGGHEHKKSHDNHDHHPKHDHGSKKEKEPH